MRRLSLPTVTLCAATSVNVAATIEALRRSLDQVEFGDAVLFTEATDCDLGEGIRIVRIEPLKSARDYSRFQLRQLADHIGTGHCLIVQWDGFVLDARQWDCAFLDFDYIGAPWPQFADGWNVGNGGFSLRSRRLLDACRDPNFEPGHPEDVAICRTNRELLERVHGIRFAGADVARRFAFEREAVHGPTFGFHGAFNLISAVGANRFWETYRGLDDPSTVFVDFGRVAQELGSGRHGWRRRARLLFDRLCRPRDS